MVKLKAKSGIMKKIYIKPSSEVFQVYMEKLMVDGHSNERPEAKGSLWFDEEPVFKKHKRDANTDVTEAVDGNSWTTYQIDLWADEVED